MCGRVVTNEEAALERYWALTRATNQQQLEGSGWAELLAGHGVNYNVPPTLPLPVTRVADGRLELTAMRWGFTPTWPGATPGRAVSNARAESVFEKHMFRRAIQSRRCIVIIDGYYEWQVFDRKKQPHYVRAVDGRPLLMAAIWQVGPDGKEEVCTLTTEPNAEMAAIHDRMPVLISDADLDTWLHSSDQSVLAALMQPAPDGTLKLVPVSSYVSNSRNAGPRCIEPVTTD